MARPFHPKVVTANHLLDGDVIYLDANEGWTRNLADAELFEDEKRAHDKLRLAARRLHEVAGVYLADAVRGKNGPKPIHFREEFRSIGPSNYPHGKREITENQA